ncbi:hypothetical protein HY992_02870 [Candidatus Micrarchaeota archaeon]|nr:hypothetical protein [Candidatus Micrarchaeota archaeon]
MVLKARRGQQGIVGCVTATPPQTLGMQPLAEPRAGTEEKLEAGTAPGKEGRGKQIVKLDTIPVGEEFKGKTHVKAWTETCRGYLASIGGRPGDRTYFFNYSEGGNKGDVQVSRGQNAVINTSDGHEITLIFESGGMDTSVRIEVRK